MSTPRLIFDTKDSEENLEKKTSIRSRDTGKDQREAGSPMTAVGPNPQRGWDFHFLIWCIKMLCPNSIPHGEERAGDYATCQPGLSHLHCCPGITVKSSSFCSQEHTCLKNIVYGCP